MDNERLVEELKTHQIELQMQNEELERVQLELEATKTRYLSLFDWAPVGYFTLDEKGLITELNLAGAAMLGMMRDSAVQKDFSLFVTRDCRDDFYLYRRVALRAKTRHKCDLRLLRKDGIEFDAHLISSVALDEQDGCRRHRLLAIDVSDRNRATAALTKSEEKYRTLFESSRDAIMMLAPPTWRFTAGNPAAIRLFGAEDEREFTSKGPWEISPEYQPDGQRSDEKAPKMIARAMQEGSRFFEWTHKTLNGKEFDATVLLTRVEFEKGKPLLQATVRDITVQKRAEEQLQERNEFLNNVLAAVTHPFYVIDADSYIIKVANPATCQPELVGKATCYSVSHGRAKPRDGPDDPCPLKEVKKTKKPAVVEHIHRDQDGNQRHVEVHAYPVLDGRGRVSEVIEYALDITDRHKRSVPCQYESRNQDPDERHHGF